MAPDPLADVYFEFLASHLGGNRAPALPPELDSRRRSGRTVVPIDQIAKLHEGAMKRLAAEHPTLDLLENCAACLAPLIDVLRASSEALRKEQAERMTTETALRESERLLRESQRAARIGSYALDIASSTWTGTAVLEDILGIAANDPHTVAAWVALVHPDERQGLQHHLTDEVLKGRGRFDRAYRIVRPNDGAVRWVHGLGELELDAEGHPVRMLGVIQDITERVLAEEKAAGFSNLLRNSLDEIFFFDAETLLFVEVNRGARENLGYSMDELRTMTPLAIKPDFTAESFACILEPLRTRRERKLRLETVHRRKDGSLYPVEVHLQLDSTVGEPVFEAIILDLTERRQAEGALMASEERMELALAGGDLGTWDWNIESGDVSFSERCIAILGYQAGDVTPSLATWKSLVHDDDMPQVQEVLAAHLKGQTDAYEAEYRLRHKSGRWIWVLDKGRVIKRDSDGKALRACGTLLDVTVRKEAELSSRRTQAALGAAQKIAHLGSWSWNIETGAEAWSDEQCRIFGYEPGAITPSHGIFVDALHPEDRSRVLEAVRTGLEDQAVYDEEFRIIRPNGSVRALHALGEVTRDADGKPVHMMGTVLDITTRKQAEAEREQAQEAVRVAYAEVRTLKDRLNAENILLRREVQVENLHGEIVGRSAAIREALALADEVAGVDAAVLLLGETGTGKELFARAIHRSSPRCDGPLISVNCAALPEMLMERELFGSEAGAFTGAVKRTIGRFEAADGGTLLLDEVGELPLPLQAKLLRVLEDGSFERLGSTRTLHSDVRIIAATNADLDQCVQEGSFRADLLYRLDVFPITLPPLRVREGDIQLLVRAFVNALAEKMGKRIDTISSESMRRLVAYEWPGNVRELRNVIERALIRSSGRLLEIPLAPVRGSIAPPRDSQATSMAEVERAHLVRVLEGVGWRVRGREGAAELLALKPSTLESRMRKHGLKRP